MHHLCGVPAVQQTCHSTIIQPKLPGLRTKQTGDGHARSVSRLQGAGEQITWASASDVVTIVGQVDRKIAFLLKTSLSLWDMPEIEQNAYRWCLSCKECSLNAHCIWIHLRVSLLERRPAQHLFKCVRNLETFLGKQAHSEEGYLHAKAEKREERGGRSETPVATVAGEMSMMCFDLWGWAVWLNLSTLLLSFECFSSTFKGLFFFYCFLSFTFAGCCECNKARMKSSQLKSKIKTKCAPLLCLNFPVTSHPFNAFSLRHSHPHFSNN